MKYEDREHLVRVLHQFLFALDADRILSGLHSCNDCKKSRSPWEPQENLCEYEPNDYEPVRYNCPFWEKIEN